MSKRCTKCSEVKALAEFDKNKDHADGIASQCRDCRLKAHRKRYFSKPKDERVRDGIEDRGKWPRNKRQSATPGEQARSTVAYAKKTGRIKAPDFCEMCGCSGPLKAHHDSYERDDWLRVVHLCQRCHSFTHAARGDLRALLDNAKGGEG